MEFATRNAIYQNVIMTKVIAVPPHAHYVLQIWLVTEFEIPRAIPVALILPTATTVGLIYVPAFVKTI